MSDALGTPPTRLGIEAFAIGQITWFGDLVAVIVCDGVPVTVRLDRRNNCAFVDYRQVDYDDYSLDRWFTDTAYNVGQINRMVADAVAHAKRREVLSRAPSGAR